MYLKYLKYQWSIKIIPHENHPWKPSLHHLEQHPARGTPHRLWRNSVITWILRSLASWRTSRFGWNFGMSRYGMVLGRSLYYINNVYEDCWIYEMYVHIYCVCIVYIMYMYMYREVLVAIFRWEGLVRVWWYGCRYFCYPWWNLELDLGKVRRCAWIQEWWNVQVHMCIYIYAHT